MMLVIASQVQVQEVYTHMVQQSKVITISGRPGIGKTEVWALLRSISWFSRETETVAKHWQRSMIEVGRLPSNNLDILCSPRIVSEYPIGIR